MITLPRTAAAFSLVAILSLAACGGSSDSGPPTGPDGDSTASAEAARGTSTAAAEGGSDEVPSTEGSLDLADYRAGTGQDELTDSTEFLTATQVLGEVEGYLTADDQLVVTGDDAQSLQYLCIAKDQLDLETYTVIVLEADGTRADC